MIGEIIFFGIPTGVLVAFIVMLVRFIRCPKEDTQSRRKYKTAAVILGVIFGAMAAAAAVLFIFIALAVKNM